MHFIIGVTPGDHAEPDPAEVEAEIARAARTWSDDLEAAIHAPHDGVAEEILVALITFAIIGQACDALLVTLTRPLLVWQDTDRRPF